MTNLRRLDVRYRPSAVPSRASKDTGLIPERRGAEKMCATVRDLRAAPWEHFVGRRTSEQENSAHSPHRSSELTGGAADKRLEKRDLHRDTKRPANGSPSVT